MNGMTGNVQIPEELREKIAQFVGETDELVKNFETKVAELEQKNAHLEQALQQKTAADYCKACGKGNECTCDMNKKASLDQDVVGNVVGNIIQAGFLKEGHRQQAIQAINDDPAGSLLDFLDKLANQRIALAGSGADMPKLGHAVSTGQESVSAQDVRESDRSFEQTFDNLSAASPA